MRTGCHYLISLSACVTFVVFTDCESCTRPIFTNPASTKAGEYGLTRVTCFLACRLELDAVAGLLWISWDFVVCFGWGADFSVFFFFFERTRPAASRRPHFASFTSQLVTGCVQGANIQLVCAYVCVTFVLFTDCDSCTTRPISTNPGSMYAGEYGLTRGTWFFARRLEVVAITGLLPLSWCVLRGVDSFVFLFSTFFFFERTRPTASTRPPRASFTSLLAMRQGRGSQATEAVFCL